MPIIFLLISHIIIYRQIYKWFSRKLQTSLLGLSLIAEQCLRKVISLLAAGTQDPRLLRIHRDKWPPVKRQENFARCFSSPGCLGRVIWLGNYQQIEALIKWMMHSELWLGLSTSPLVFIESSNKIISTTLITMINRKGVIKQPSMDGKFHLCIYSICGSLPL